MTPKQNHTLSADERQATIQELLQDRMRLAIRHTLITVLEEEVETFIQAALYQRTPDRKDCRNGHFEIEKNYHSCQGYRTLEFTHPLIYYPPQVEER